MKTLHDIPAIGDRIRIRVNNTGGAAPFPATVVAIDVSSDRMTYSVDLDGYGILHGECNKTATPFYPATH